MSSLRGGCGAFPKIVGFTKRKKCHFCGEWTKISNLNLVYAVCKKCSAKGRKAYKNQEETK